MGQNNARMTDVGLLVQAGIDPKTKLPIKVSGADSQLKSNIKRFLRIIDEQDAVNRFKWNLPEGFGLTGQELERFLYYKGQMCFFKLEDKYYLMPFALDGSIDFYGRYNTIHPVPMTSGVNDENELNSATYKAQVDILNKLKLKVIYKPEDFKDILPEQCAVILWDYSRQYNAQNITPRVVVNDGLIDVMSCMIPYLKTNAIMSSGVRGIRCPDADSEKDIEWGSKNIDKCALSQEVFVPITGSLELQELMDKTGGKMQEYMQTLQSLDNLRLSSYGLDNGGMFEKKSHELEAEQATNNQNASLCLEDGLEIRKHFCDIVNKVFGVKISVEANNSDESMNIGGDEDIKGGNENVSNQSEL